MTGLLGAGRLPAIPAVLLLGIAVCYFLPARRRGAGRLVAAVALLTAVGLAISLAGGSSAPGGPEASLGEAVPGVPLLLRADGPGLVVALAALVAALLALAEGARRPLEEAALLICALGACIAAFAGNIVLLFGGSEIANVGMLLLFASGRGRLGRGLLAAFIVEHLAALGLLFTAVELQLYAGTTDPRALPATAVGGASAAAWAVAGGARLLSLLIAPGSRDPRASRAWMAVEAVPVGAITLLRLDQASSAAPAVVGIVLLAVAGTAAAIGGAVLAVRRSDDVTLAGRGLLVALAGTAVALAGLPGAITAFAVALTALELALLSAPAWGPAARAPRGGRVVAAVALLSAAGLPLGVGTTATAVTLGGVASLGRVYLPVLLGLTIAALLTAAGGLRASASALRLAADPQARLRLDSVAVLAVSAALALLPGALLAAPAATLAFGAALQAPDAASLAIAGAGWPGGYVTVAAIVLATAVAAALALLGRRVAAPAPLPGVAPQQLWTPLLRPRRRTRPALAAGLSWVGRIDTWLIPQPQLAFVLVAAVVALFVFR